MKAASKIYRPSEIMGAGETSSPRRLARVTGILYLVLAVFGMFSPVVLETLLIPDDAAATAENILSSQWLFGSSLVSWLVIVIADVAISITLYLLLEPVNRALSLIAAAFRLVYSAMLGVLLVNLYDAFSLLTRVGQGTPQQQAVMQATAFLETFSTGFLLALVFFGIHLGMLGSLFYRSRYVPRAFGVLLVVAGIGYTVDSLAKIFVADYGGFATALFLAPAVAGELGLTTWLLMKGVKVR